MGKLSKINKRRATLIRELRVGPNSLFSSIGKIRSRWVSKEFAKASSSWGIFWLLAVVVVVEAVGLVSRSWFP